MTSPNPPWPSLPHKADAHLGPIYIDLTHCADGRKVTGIERIALELFNDEAMRPLPVRAIRANGVGQMVRRQTLMLPRLLAADRRAVLVCPGFPPTPPVTLFGARVLPYIHDLFLITRPHDLNLKAKVYMAPSFRFAVKRAPRFLVNSQKTAAELRRFCRPTARIDLYRPVVRNSFSVAVGDRAERSDAPAALKLIAIGTVEPRKNLRAAAAILQVLRDGPFPGSTLDVIGRVGWGDDAEFLKTQPGVTMHGFQPEDRIRELIEAADLFITTSHDEGLGAPPLEAQWSGIPVVAPDIEVFREVLAHGGRLFIDAADAKDAAARIAGMIAQPGWRKRLTQEAVANVERWNADCASDRQRAVALIERLASGDASC